MPRFTKEGVVYPPVFGSLDGRRQSLFLLFKTYKESSLIELYEELLQSADTRMPATDSEEILFPVVGMRSASMYERYGLGSYH